LKLYIIIDNFLEISIDNFAHKAYILPPLEGTMYAVIEAGGKQHKVELGQTLEIDLMQEESGAEHAFETVMLYVDGEDVQVGQPFIENAKVIAEIVEEVKEKKSLYLDLEEENIA
jgi:ribosomal protein L21